MFGEARPELSWRCQRSRGLITAEAIPVCELLVCGSHAEPTQIHWNPDAVRRFNIDIERFKAMFAHAFEGATPGALGTSGWHI